MKLSAPVVLLFASSLLANASAGPVTPTYFLVSEKPDVNQHGDSFIVPLIDSDQIAHARDLIAHGADAAGESIVVARVAAAFDGINRDLLAPDRHAWDWHVTEVEQFADLSAEILDGWPGFVQDNTSSWITETNGRIGFWSYTITRELPDYPAELPPVSVPLPPAALTSLASLAAALLCACLAAARMRRRSDAR